MRKEIYIPILGIMTGEIIMYFGQITIGLLIHMSNLLLITLIIIFSNLNIKEKNTLQSSTLAIVLRAVNVSMPRFFTPLLQYSIIYGIMFVPIFLIIKNQGITREELGINFSRLYFYIPLAIFIGSITAIIEYQILSPDPILSMQKIRIFYLISLGIVMFIFIGIVEETIFRSIIQTRFEQIFGANSSILLSGIIFGIMHSTYGILYEILFTIIFGIFIGYIFHRTHNLPFIVSIHGVTNVILFGILPTLS